MRTAGFILLAALAAVVAALAYENREQQIPVTLFGNGFYLHIPALVGSTYLAGMLSGWALVGALRWSLTRPPKGGI